MPKDDEPFYTLSDFIKLCRIMGYDPLHVYAIHITPRIVKFTYETPDHKLETKIHEVSNA